MRLESEPASFVYASQIRPHQNRGEALPKSQALNRTPEDEISDTPSGRILNASEAAADAEELSEAEKLRDDWFALLRSGTEPAEAADLSDSEGSTCCTGP